MVGFSEIKYKSLCLKLSKYEMWRVFQNVYVRLRNGCLEFSDRISFDFFWYVPLSDIFSIALQGESLKNEIGGERETK